MTISFPVLVLGMIVGITYGLLAVGLVIVYRTSRIINFAHGATGALGAAVLGLLVVRYGVPYWLAFPFAIAVSAGAGAAAEAVVVRRLRHAPRIMSLVATLGIGAFYTSLGPAMFAQVNATNVYPQPSWLPSFGVGRLVVTPAHTAMLVFSPVLVLAFAAFLRRSRHGLALRGAAANPDRARMVGVYASRMSMLAWSVAGAFAGFTAILVFPTRGFAGGEAFGPVLLLRALAAAVVARMDNLPFALAAGVGIGIVEQQIYWNTQTPGIPSVLLLATIAIGLLVQRRGQTRTRERESWTAVEPSRRLDLPDAARRRIRTWSLVAAAAIGAAALSLPAVVSSSSSLGMATVYALATVALSIGIVTGLGGHLSLGAFAFAGIGAIASLRVSDASGNYVLGLLAAGAAGGAAAVAVGIPALRIRGIMYAVATLAFAFSVQDFLLRQPWVLGPSSVFGRPTFGPARLETGRAYYWWALGALAVAYWLAWRVRSGGLGRSFVALRDNEDAARSFSVPVIVRTVQLFAIGGVLAGVGGAVFAHGIGNLGASAFSPDVSIEVVAAAVLGGLGSSAGPLLGSLYIFAVPKFVRLDSAALAGSALGWLLLILYVPGGLGSLVVRARDVLATRLFGTPSTVHAEPGLKTHPLALRAARARTARDDRTIVSLSGLTKRFGGVTAVSNVSLDLRRGEVLALIGPNGAGKTTLFELAGGSTAPDAGTILLDGTDITRMTPEARTRLGLVRSFQDSRLFPTMTVLDVLRLAQERSTPTSFVSSIVSAGASEAVRDRAARETLDLMGLGPYATRRVGELSTGMRRICELAAMIALRPRVLLLDEPSTGIAQRESEALRDLLLRVRDHLDATLVVIEHDVPLVLAIADRVAAMEAGELIALGTPDAVAADARVIESYLGGDPSAVARSVQTKRTARRMRPATTG